MDSDMDLFLSPERMRQQKEAAIVRYILKETGLGAGGERLVLAQSVPVPPRLTFGGLMAGCGFPLALYALSLSQRRRQLALADLMISPRRSQLYQAWTEYALGGSSALRRYGIVFSWPKTGRRYWAFHAYSGGRPPEGMFLTIKDRRYSDGKMMFFLEPLKSLLARIGPPGDW